MSRGINKVRHKVITVPFDLTDEELKDVLDKQSCAELIGERYQLYFITPIEGRGLVLIFKKTPRV